MKKNINKYTINIKTSLKSKKKLENKLENDKNLLLGDCKENNNVFNIDYIKNNIITPFSVEIPKNYIDNENSIKKRITKNKKNRNQNSVKEEGNY